MANYTEAAGTLTNQASTLFAAKQRNGLIVGNPSDTVMTARFGAAASAAAGVPIAAGAALYLSGKDAPWDSVSLFCAGTSKAYTAYEW